MKEWKDEIWKRRKEGKREREGERACVAPLVARAHVSRAIGVEKG